jgi:RecB family exonuclease
MKVNKKLWNKNLLTEYSIEQNLGDIIVKGNLDKIEIIDDGKVNVVDYKTGKNKNKENYRRQLQFYKMLLDLEGKYTMVSGQLDFIELNKKEVFEIDDTKEIIQTTKEVSNKIMNGDFSGGCNEKDCEFCELAKLLQN